MLKYILLLMVLPSMAYAEVGGLDQEFIDYSKEQLLVVLDLVRIIIPFIGLMIFGWGLYAIKRSAENPERYKPFGYLAALGIGSMFMASGHVYEIVLNSFAIDDNDIVGYVQSGNGISGSVGQGELVFLFISAVGFFAIFRGLYIFYLLGREVQGSSMAKGVTHVAGGAIANNLSAIHGALSAIPVIGPMVQAISGS